MPLSPIRKLPEASSIGQVGGSWRHLESFSGGFFFGVHMFAGMSSQILGEKFGI